MLSKSSLPLLAVAVLIKIGLLVYLSRVVEQLKQPVKTHSYIAHDYPRLWSIPERETVRMFIEDTVWYQSHGPDADKEWEALTPNNGIIFLGEHRRPYSISMFHQLRCIDIFRRELVRQHAPDPQSPPSELSRHCLNYLRQMILCTADTRLDALLGRPEVQAFPDVYECKDWDAVYQAVDDNQKDYERWQSLARKE